jgi:hypothetical protein
MNKIGIARDRFHLTDLAAIRTGNSTAKRNSQNT